MRLVPHCLRNLMRALWLRIHPPRQTTRPRFFTTPVMETTMSKSKYAHLVHDGNVVYLPGNGPMNFQFSAEREAARAADPSSSPAPTAPVHRLAARSICCRRALPQDSIGEHGSQRFSLTLGRGIVERVLTPVPLPGVQDSTSARNVANTHLPWRRS